MGYKTFRQTDNRWSNYSYNKKPYTMGTSGCGPTACASIIVNNPKHSKVTPKTTRKFCMKHGYATYGNGTYWGGIPAMLKHYGFEVKQHTNITSFFNEMKLSGRSGVILFCKGTRGGVTWTSSGHYVAVTNYKKKNSKHYLYTRDPNGSRKNDGWHCYETTMKGLVSFNCLYTAHLPGAKNELRNTKKKYSGTLPTLPEKGYLTRKDKGTQVTRLQKFLIWYGYKIKADGVFGKETCTAVKDFKQSVGLKRTQRFGKKSLAMAKTVKR